MALLFWLIAIKKGASTQKPNKIKCKWCWLGAVTNDSITIKAKLNGKVITGKNYIQIWYHLTPNLDVDNRAINKVPATFLEEEIATFNLVDLVEDTIYYYVIIADGRRYPTEGTLQFKTVKVNQPYSFAIACSSCAGGTISQFASYGVSNSKVFDVISKYQIENGQDSNLALFIHMGDLHYRNDIPILGLKEDYLDDYRHNYDLVMTQARQKNLYQNIPLAYIWDDHDYGTNDSDGSYNLKYLASKVYREQVPSYPLVEALDQSQSQGAIYQSFIIGRVRFILTDSRFYQEPITSSHNPNKTLLGRKQKAWLFEQLKIGKRQQQNSQEGLIIWVNSIPWIAQTSNSKTGSWDKFEDERNEIANFIKENKIDKLLMISGDAHMLALDDGTPGTANSYATGGGGSFPVIQAASLDSRGSVKGGLYNGGKYIIDSKIKSINGAIPGKGQWGLLNFIDHGNKIEVKVELKRMKNTLIKHTFVFD
ncbi:MAG: alkaline phosphatase D family protein [Cyanobacteria bacterium P01_E01_bin.35]